MFLLESQYMLLKTFQGPSSVSSNSEEPYTDTDTCYSKLL